MGEKSVQAPLDFIYPRTLYYVHRKCGADWVIKAGVIDFIDITYVVSGRGVYRVNGTDYPVSPGSLVCVPFGSLRQAWTEAKDPLDVYAVNFALTQPSGASGDLPFPVASVAGYDRKLLAFFAQLTRVWSEREPLYEQDANALVTQIICELYRRLCCHKPVNRLDERVEKVKNYIHEHYHAPLDLNRLAKVAGLSPVYLGAVFSRSEACSVNEYINKVRVQNALEIIRTEKVSVNDVAQSCGYSDAFYFSRVFKRYIGISPSQARMPME